MAEIITMQQLEIKLTRSKWPEAPVILDFRRAVFLPELEILLISDLHWGKSETFRRHGIPIPQPLFEADLQRLSDLILHYDPQRILILGDLIHGKLGLTPVLFQTVCHWRERHPVPMTLIAGNHDRHVQELADTCAIGVTYENVQEAGFHFSHHPVEKKDFFTWCGHIHPTLLLANAIDQVRLPCFHLTRTQGTLPAFSEFTGGYNIRPNPSDCIVAITQEGLIPIQYKAFR